MAGSASMAADSAVRSADGPEDSRGALRSVCCVRMLVENERAPSTPEVFPWATALTSDVSLALTSSRVFALVGSRAPRQHAPEEEDEDGSDSARNGVRQRPVFDERG